IQIDPYGNMLVCRLIRKPAFNLFQVDIDYAKNALLAWIRNSKFTTASPCNGCNLRQDCYWCPGKAYIEQGNLEQPIDFYCELAHRAAAARR
ncbi:hypothetical protein ACFL2I_06880, partial [Candidatus Omnitrophota bacterium]